MGAPNKCHTNSKVGVGEVAVSGAQTVERRADLSQHMGDKWSGGRRPLKFLLAESRPRPQLAAGRPPKVISWEPGVGGRASQQGAQHPRWALGATHTDPIPSPNRVPAPGSRREGGRRCHALWLPRPLHSQSSETPAYPLTSFPTAFPFTHHAPETLSPFNSSHQPNSSSPQGI